MADETKVAEITPETVDDPKGSVSREEFFAHTHAPVGHHPVFTEDAATGAVFRETPKPDEETAAVAAMVSWGMTEEDARAAYAKAKGKKAADPTASRIAALVKSGMTEDEAKKALGITDGGNG